LKKNKKIREERIWDLRYTILDLRKAES
jgi:hypothetical protein